MHRGAIASQTKQKRHPIAANSGKRQKGSKEQNMRTNEEIINKIRELMYEEYKAERKCREIKKDCQKRGQAEAALDMLNSEKTHSAIYESLAKILIYASND